ncbi:MAG: trigger factor [Bacteroidales bacterium]
MNITLEKIDELNAVVKVTVEKPDYHEEVESALKKQRRNAQLKGFRPGMAPMGLIRKLYGKAVLLEELNGIVSNKLSDYITTEKLDILGDPLPHEADPDEFDNMTDFTFSFDIGLTPQFEPQFSKKSKIPYYIITPDQKMKDGFIDNHRRRHGEFIENDTVGEQSMIKGTTVSLNEDNEPAEGGIRAENVSLLLSMVDEESEKNLFIGKRVGETVIFDIRKTLKNETEISSFLKIAKDDLDYAVGNFALEIESVSTFEPASLNAEFFKKVYGGEEDMTETQFISKVEEEIAENLRKESDYRFRVDAIDYAVEKTKLDLPEAFLKRWLLTANKDLSEEQIEKEFDSFRKDMKWQLIRNRVASMNELKVSEEDLMQEAMAITRNQFMQYGLYYATDEQISVYARELLKKEEEARRLADRVLDTKVTDFIRENVKLDEKKITSEQFNKLFE